MKRDTLIEHKEIIICEESELKGYTPFFSQIVNKNGRKEIVGVDLNHANWYCMNCNMKIHSIEYFQVRKKIQ